MNALTLKRIVDWTMNVIFFALALLNLYLTIFLMDKISGRVFCSLTGVAFFVAGVVFTKETLEEMKNEEKLP